MSPLGKRIIILSMFWVFLVMIFTQVYDNVTGRNLPPKQPEQVATEPTPAGPNPAVSRLADLQACVAANPRDLNCTLELADLYFVNQQWPLSQTNYERAVEIDPHNVPAWLRLAATLIYQNQFDKAVPVLQQAGNLEPNNPEIQLLLGLALSRQDPPRNAEAISAWQRVMQLAPDTDLARQAAAYIAEADR
jgi:cytochrome c-type biogenesis protein CcmH/NrfG